MGLFGPKIPAEEKAYIKALKSAPISKAKDVPELLAATEAYPTGWQGYWFLGLYYDFAHDKGAQPDHAKAQEYFLKAESAAAANPDAANWLRNFMSWYRRPAGNLRRNLSERAQRVRSLGVALLNCYQYQNPIVMGVAGKKDDVDTFSAIIASCGSWEEINEYEPFTDYFHKISELSGLIKKDHEEMVKDVNAIVKKYNKANDTYESCIKAISKGKEPNWDKLQDWHSYILGFNCLNDGPYITGELAASWNMSSEAALGIRCYLFSAHHGNQAAIHELVRLSKASDSNYSLMSGVFAVWNPSYQGDLELWLLEKLLKCAEKDDSEAMRLAELYYAEEMANNSAENG